MRLLDTLIWLLYLTFDFLEVSIFSSIRQPVDTLLVRLPPYRITRRPSPDSPGAGDPLVHYLVQIRRRIVATLHFPKRSL